MSTDVLTYVNKLLNNEDISTKESKNYIKGIHNSDGINPKYTQLVERVRNFLINKLEHGEC